MERHEWNFEYTAAKIADAAKLKKEHHIERLAWWENKQKELIAEVKNNGLEITESLTATYATSSLFNNSGAQLTVKADYQSKLNECHQKIREHASKSKEYDGWVQMLEANSEQRVSVSIEDWLFFFGK